METMELAALGRPFSLGMLYDCRQDSLVPGMTLWDSNALEKDIRERSQHNSDFEIVASESIEDKSSALNVEASLKASFLSGLVQVEGSAKYLNDCKISKNQARVTLKYKTTTKFQELSMDHLGRGNVKHLYVFDKGIATHVVTGILYGAQAFFVFDHELSEKEDHQEVEGNLKVMIKNILRLEIDGEGSLQMRDKDIANAEKFSCKFHGDFNLENNPVSFQDAIQVYQSLPKLLGANGENAVPMKVWLMPLKSLDSSAAQLVREISIRLVLEAQKVLEDFSELEMRCNDAMKSTTAQQFPQIHKKMKTFKELCSEYKLEFQQTLAKKLPSIRGGGEEEAVLAEILEKRHSSPFNNKNLSEWIDCKEKEINLVKSLTNMMKNTKIVTSQNALDNEILSAEHAVCFAFTSLGNAEPYLSALSNYSKETPTSESPEEITCHTHDAEKEQWYFSFLSVFLFFFRAIFGLTRLLKVERARKEREVDDTQQMSWAGPGTSTLRLHGMLPRPQSEQDTTKQWYFSKEVSDTMREKAKLFIDFAETNKDNKNIRFLAAGMTGETQKGATIYLYKEGSLVNDNFELPSTPETPTVSDTTHNSVTVNICPPTFGAEDSLPTKIWSSRQYTVEYCADGEGAWQQKIATKAKEVTVSGLTPNTEYIFRCRAVCSVGKGPASEVSGSITTLPTSPPGKPQVEANSSEISVSWEKPAELGKGVILKYIVEYAKAAPGVKHEELEWNQKVSRAETAVISGLQPETEYAVRVRFECGLAARSKESITVNVWTTKRELECLRELLKCTSKHIKSESPSVYQLCLEKEDMDIDGCSSYSFGKANMRRNRTIMVLGATGSGKSTLINGMINYIVGIEWNDTFRFKLVDEGEQRSQAESQTSQVTVYKINHKEGFKIPYSLTIVDTPGFGDTRGIERDRAITEQIRRLFTSAKGVSEIDAVCFVTQAALPRLTPTQKYVFDSVLSIFGKDVAENIRMLVTFADGQQPPVLEAINVSGVPCPKTDKGLPVHFKFNNSALFADNRSIGDTTCDADSDEDMDFDKMFWSMGAKSMKNFFTVLDKMTTKSLQMTKEVLKERRQLETAVEGLQPQIKAGLAKLEEIKMTKQKIQEHEAAMSSNEKFEIEVDITKAVKIEKAKKEEYLTNCQQCSITCHYPCGIADDNGKRGCVAMDGNGNCTVCPGKCIWSVHYNQKYRWDYVTVKEKQTLQDLKEKYEKATEAKLSVQEVIEKQEEEIANLQDVMVSLLEESAQCLARLKEIALRPNPLSTPEYIDLLIEGEKSEAKEGYLARIQSLEAMKQKARIISKVANQEKLTTTEQEIYDKEQKRQKKPGILKKLTDFFRW
ncbi:uncharacterized protein [Centroberyx affinis]|uniref:uncharacterized protein n=1 Tax=Centroberyx affinis TaxID=166261 RepID=UPI003A5BBA7A